MSLVDIITLNPTPPARIDCLSREAKQLPGIQSAQTDPISQPFQSTSPPLAGCACRTIESSRLSAAVTATCRQQRQTTPDPRLPSTTSFTASNNPFTTTLTLPRPSHNCHERRSPSYSTTPSSPHPPSPQKPSSLHAPSSKRAPSSLFVLATKHPSSATTPNSNPSTTTSHQAHTHHPKIVPKSQDFTCYSC